MSAAVRLGVCGPMEAQALQARLAAGTLEPLLVFSPAAPPSAPLDAGSLPSAPAAPASDLQSDGAPPSFPLDAEGWARCGDRTAGDASRGRAAPEPGAVRHTAPLAELLQATQDRLYSRLFNS